MKMIKIFIILITSLSYSAELPELNIDWEIYSDIEIKEYFYKLKYDQRKKLYDGLALAKVSLLNGEVKRSLNILNKILIRYKNTPLKVIALRYLAFSYFTLGEFKKAYEILDDNVFLRDSYYKEICTLKIASSLYLKPSAKVKHEYDRCYTLNLYMANDNAMWFEYLEDTQFGKTKDYKYFQSQLLFISNFSSASQSRIWLKFALLNNFEVVANNYLTLLPEESFKDDINRSLMAYVSYNAKKRKQAIQFIEDLNSANASFLKSINEINKGDYKAALAFNRVAHSRRPYSVNSNQLMVPLAWLNKDWQRGRYSLVKLLPPDELKREQLLLKTAFMIEEKDFKRADRSIDDLYYLYNKKMPFEALVIKSYVKLKLLNENWVDASEDSCVRFDGINCWLRLQSLIWPKYEQTLSKLSNKREKTFEVLNKLKEPAIKIPLKESEFIRQKDIEELDEELQNKLKGI